MFAWTDFVSDCAFVDLLTYHMSLITELPHGLKARGEQDDPLDPNLLEYHTLDYNALNAFVWVSILGIVIPMLAQIYSVAMLIKKTSKRRHFDTDILTGYIGITVIFIACTDPDMVMLLPFLPDAYEVGKLDMDRTISLKHYSHLTPKSYVDAGKVTLPEQGRAQVLHLPTQPHNSLPFRRHSSPSTLPPPHTSSLCQSHGVEGIRGHNPADHPGGIHHTFQLSDAFHSDEPGGYCGDGEYVAGKLITLTTSP